MTKPLLLSVLLAASCGAGAEVVYEHAGPVVLQSGGTTSFTPANWPDISGAEYARLSFEMREYDLNPDGTVGNGFLNWTFRNAAGESFMNYTTVQGLHLLVWSPSGKSILGDTASGSTAYVRVPYGESGDDYGWSTFEIESGTRNFIAKIDGVSNYSDQYTFLPFKGLSFWMYGKRKFEMRNIRLETLPAPIIEKVPEPTFSAAGEVPFGTNAVPRAVSSAVGGVMFWTKFVPGTECVRLLDAEGNLKARFYCYGDYRIQADIAVAGSSDKLVYKRRLFEETTRASDDFHYAFTWDENGLARFFLNGVPYTLGSGGDDAEFPITGNDLDGVAQVIVCPGKKQVVRDLAVYRRALTNDEVQAAYRARMPVDLAFNDSVLAADEPDALLLTVAPGGTYTLPAPVDGAAPVTGTVDVAVVAQRIVAVTNAAGKRVRYDYPEVGRWTHTAVAVTNATDLALDGLTLARGSYRALVTVTAPGAEPVLRTKLFSALPAVAAPAPAPDRTPWQKTDLLWSKDFTAPDDMPYAQGAVTAVESPLGTYLESGPTGGLSGNRMGTIVEFPAEAKGHPCLLEIDWPDDRDRLIGWCMFLETTASAHRDRLMAGVAAGDRLKRTDRMQTARYLFYPSSTNHLFEVRTLSTGRPGAIAALRVWRLAEPLPVLKVHRPEGYPARRFGHVDEDQTFYFLLNDQYVSGMDGVTAALADYFGYTGESLFNYTLFRYTASFAPSDLRQAWTGYAGAEGEIPYVLRQFANLGIAFEANEGLYGEPHVVHANRIQADYEAMGFISRDAEGYSPGSGFAGDAYPNMANTNLQDRFFAYCEDYLRRCARSGLKVLRVPVTMLGCYQDADYGQDAWSLAKFTADTGLAKPSDDDAAWRTWRCAQVTGFFARFVAWAKDAVPGLEVRLMLPAGSDDYRETYGVDVAEIAKIEGCTFGFERGYTQYWWDLYRSNNTNTANYAALYDAAKPVYAALRSAGRSAAEATSDGAYFETYRDSLVNDRFATYFQSLDVKPWGRNFLREPAHMVGTLDALSYTVGGQPLGTLGQETETREFVQAYSALPALPFADVPSTAAGIVCRSLVTTNGTYFYLVSLTNEVRSVRVCAAEGLSSVVDLSSEATLETDAFALKEYQLRSFLIPGETVSLTSVEDADGAGVGDVVTLLRGDGADESAMTNALAWSDGEVPHADAPYLVANGLDAPFCTIEGTVAEDRTDVWPGGSLEIGSSVGAAGALVVAEHGDPANAGNAWSHIKEYPKFKADGLLLTKGEIRFAAGPYARLQGSATVRASGDDPFVVRLAKASNFLETDLTGGETAALCFTKDGSDSVGNYRIFVSGDNAAYKGQMIFDGVTLSSGEKQATSFGSSLFLRKDALVFRNGARIRPDFNWTLQPGNVDGTSTFSGDNRGMTFESGSGIRLYGKSTLVFKLGVFGETVHVWGDWGGGESRRAWMERAILEGPVGVDTFVIGNEGTSSAPLRDLPRLVFGESATVDRVPTVEGGAYGTIGANGCAVKVKRLLTGTESYFESGFDADETTLGHVVLTEGSTLGSGNVVIRVEGYPRRAAALRLPVLTVPVSARAALTAEEVVFKNLSFGASALEGEVASDGTNHVVYVKFTEGLSTQRFVVPPDSAAAAVVASDGAFHSWATAATNLADALEVAVAGDTVYVAKGIHPIASTIVLSNDVTVLGVDPATMIPDSGAILDGGYPARTNRIFKLKKAKLDHLTFRNAATTSAGCDSSWAPGGAAINCAQDSAWRATDCVFSNCLAIGTSGGAISTYDTWNVDSCVRCLFVDCRADDCGGAIECQFDDNVMWFGCRGCVFLRNRAKANGGALYAYFRGLHLTDCSFEGNVAEGSGGGFFAGYPTLANCVFDGTGVTTGSFAAFAVESDTGGSYRDVVVRNYNLPNRALAWVLGPAVFDGLVMTNNVCSRLLEQYKHEPNPVLHIAIRNALFADNTIGSEAFLAGGHCLDLENCTLVGNRMNASARYLRGISNGSGGNYWCRATIVNGIFRENGTSAPHRDEDGYYCALTITNSIFDCAADGSSNVNVWNVDPRLDSAFMPSGDSPAVDAGVWLDWMTTDATDVRGARRMRPTGCPDLGAVERAEAEVGVVATEEGETIGAHAQERIRTWAKESFADYPLVEQIRVTGPTGLVTLLAEMGISPEFPNALDDLGILNLVYARPTLTITGFDAQAKTIRFKVAPGEGNRVVSMVAPELIAVYGTDDLYVPMECVSSVEVDLAPYLGTDTKGEGVLTVGAAPVFLEVKIGAGE